MKIKHQRLIFMSLGGLIISLAGFLIISAFGEALTFFYTPSQVHEKKIPLHTRIRIGGMVKKGSVKKQELKVTFVVTDFTKDLHVVYEGLLPDLFKEGQGVVAEGELTPSAIFKAKTILAKHDEKYMPPSLQQVQGGLSNDLTNPRK